MKRAFLFSIFFILLLNSAYEQLSPLCELKNNVTVVNGTQQCNYNSPLILKKNYDFQNITLEEFLQDWTVPYQGAMDVGYTQWYANNGVSPYININHNIEISDGKLKLIAQKEIPPIEGTFCTVWDEVGNCINSHTLSFDYSSATIQSKVPYSYGKFEIKCKLPAGHGFFPAFWLFSSPPWNEIDVFEFNNNSTTDLLMTVHYDANHDGSAKDPPEACGTDKNEGIDFSSDFYTYTIIWNEYYIEWFVNGISKRKALPSMALVKVVRAFDGAR